ncbi:M23 family metallopeptidase [Trueperella sp. LYQ143]|uniref:M23 family metallopeptidase n=1 Tax=unclassified Trueperella TaxID=2630174 RepID=UPI003983754E
MSKTVTIFITLAGVFHIGYGNVPDISLPPAARNIPALWSAIRESEQRLPAEHAPATPHTDGNSGSSSTSNPTHVPAIPSLPARDPSSAESLSDTVYMWPSGHPVAVLRPFRPGQHVWDRGHRGVDLALNAGDPIYAAADGIVIYAGEINDRSVISIEHPDGIRTTYEPVEIHVKRGQQVIRGQQIGVVTGTHCAPSSCLHWGAKRGAREYINPLSLLADQRIRLYN